MSADSDALRERVKSVWLLSFGDMTTLLITFFVMMLALNYGAISRVQKWLDDELTHTYAELKRAVREERLTLVSVMRDSRGVVLRIRTDGAFASGSATPSTELLRQVTALGRTFRYLRLFNEQATPAGRAVLALAEREQRRFQPEISVEGHTDSDPIAPWSPLRNNWILSAQRAQRVLGQLLYASAMDPRWFSVAGYGASRPLVPNDTPAHKAMNRRVEIVITAGFVAVEADEGAERPAQPARDGKNPAAPPAATAASGKTGGRPRVVRSLSRFWPVCGPFFRRFPSAFGSRSAKMGEAPSAAGFRAVFGRLPARLDRRWVKTGETPSERTPDAGLLFRPRSARGAVGSAPESSFHGFRRVWFSDRARPRF